MNIVLQTALDKYQTNCFPTNLEFVPRIGESVMVVDVFINYYRELRLPVSLRVVNVTHTDKCVICELWYDKMDVASAKLNNINLF